MSEKSDTSSEPERVTVPRIAVATAIDLLTDLEKEVNRADASGPYLDEISSTIETLEDSMSE